MTDIHNSNRNQQIGNICVQWAGLEYYLAGAIWSMLSLNMEIGKIITGGLDAKQRATMAHAIAHQVNAPIYLKRGIKRVLDKMRDNLIERRNQAVHGIHFPSTEAGSVYVEMHRGRGGRASRLQKDADLHALGKEISNEADKLAAAVARYAGEKLHYTREQMEALGFVFDMATKTASAKDDGETNGPS